MLTYVFIPTHYHGFHKIRMLIASGWRFCKTRLYEEELALVADRLRFRKDLVLHEKRVFMTLYILRT